MHKDLLLEIGAEEIPAGFVTGALKAMPELAAKALADARLTHGEISAYGNPRRLALIVRGLSARQPDAVREVTGPPKKAAYDASGNPTKAATGFASSQGVGIESLTIKTTDKGEYLCAVIDEKGRDAAEVLSELLPKFIFSIPFPKSMRWMDKEIRFARPIHWILALLGGETVHFELDGVKSSNISRGHRFMSPGAFMVKDPDSYLQLTTDNYTIVDPDVRRRMVVEQVVGLAESAGAVVLPDEGLVEEVANLVEYPVAVMGKFDKEYLNLPREALVNAMREHQRYFALTDKDGYLMPNFITISNTKAEDMDVVRVGNERVLRARLSDAKFFFDEDMAHPLEDRVKDLKNVVFQVKLGSVYDKVQRVSHLAGFVADTLYGDGTTTKYARRAAHLCKADLLTSMVYEFANLQGIMGCDYAKRNGEPHEVAAAIAEHYMPRFSGDSVPETKTGTALSIADKMDTITGIFSAGKAPTGSEDPYALRRQALGIISIIYQGGIRTSLRTITGKSVEQLKLGDDESAKLVSDVMEFFRQRVNNQLTGEGYAYDTVDAVLAREFDDIIDARNRVKALSEFRKDPGFGPFITTFKRVANILPEGFEGRLDPALLSETAEREIYEQYETLSPDVSALVDEERYGEALFNIGAIRPAVDSFFDAVLVMDKDEAVKRNRLALIGLLAGMFFRIADLKKIVV